VLRHGAGDSAAAARALLPRPPAGHLGRSPLSFTAAMRADAQTAFYRELANLAVPCAERECVFA
jgi:hypothetical protein